MGTILYIRAQSLTCLLAALAVICGCVSSSGPTEPIVFDDIDAIERLIGYYRNRGDAGPDEDTEIFLSELIWVDRELDHPSIAFIKVTLERSDALLVTSIGEAENLPSEVFVKDRDFVIKKGRISLGRDSEILGGENLALGVSTTRAWLGFEDSGHGLYRQSSSAGALVFALIPAAAFGQQDVRFEHAATREALMPVEGGASSAFPETATVVRNGELEQEIQRYISAFDGGNDVAKQQVLEALSWSGISDARLFNPMEEELLRRYQAKTRSVAAKLSRLIQGLSYSGQARYRPSLQKVASEAEKGVVKTHAAIALQRLEQYARWNPIILAGADDTPEGSLNELRICNMIRSSDPLLRRIGAREANRNFLRNERVVAAANEGMLHEFNRNLDHPNQIDSVLWLMKVVANSENPDYVNSFNEIAAKSPVEKIAGRAEDYALRLQRQQTGQRFIDTGALLPGSEALSGVPVSVVSVIDERQFATGIRNSSAPSMAQPAGVVPAEKRAALIAVIPGRTRFRLEPFALLSLPVGSSVQGEVRSLLEAGLNRRFSSEIGRKTGLIELNASIEQFWGWWTAGLWSIAVEARIGVRLNIVGPSSYREIIYVEGSGTHKTQMLTESGWQKAYELAYSDFLSNLDDELRRAGF